MAAGNELGKIGEQAARDYLVAHGYALYTIDDRTGGAEVDIIAFKGDTVAFVEVKTRTRAMIDPMEVVTPQQQRRICRAADNFLRRNGIRHEARFDIITVAITGPESAPVITHYKDAFRPRLTSVR